MAPAIQISAEKEYEKNPDLCKDDIHELQEWLKEEPHLPAIGESQLILFFHSCMYDIEMTKKTIDYYYTLRSNCPDYFIGRSIDNNSVQNALDLAIYTSLPTCTPEGYRIMLLHLLDREVSHFVLIDALKLFCMIMDLWLFEEGTAPGYVLVFDMDGFGFNHLFKLGFTALKNYLFYLQEALPVRLKQIHFINFIPFMDKGIALVRPFMKKKIIDALHFHPKVESISPYVPIKCLPNELGGEAGTYEELRAKTITRVTENSQYFRDDEEMRVDESKRIVRNGPSFFSKIRSFVI